MLKINVSSLLLIFCITSSWCQSADGDKSDQIEIYKITGGYHIQNDSEINLNNFFQAIELTISIVSDSSSKNLCFDIGKDKLSWYIGPMNKIDGPTKLKIDTKGPTVFYSWKCTVSDGTKGNATMAQELIDTKGSQPVYLFHLIFEDKSQYQLYCIKTKLQAD